MAFQAYFRRRDQERHSLQSPPQLDAPSQPNYIVEITQFQDGAVQPSQSQRQPEYNRSYNLDGTLPGRVLHLKSNAPTIQTTFTDDDEAEAEADGIATPPDLEKDLEKGNGFVPGKAVTTSEESTVVEKELEKDSGEDSQPPKDVDPNIVDWDGPDDPANPQNWPSRKKWNCIAIMSFITFLTPLASTMFAPAVPEVMADFHQSNTQIASLIVSIYIMGYIFGPLVIAPLSELYGRRIIFMITNVMFTGFMIGCSRSTNVGEFLAFRFLTGGVIADLMKQEKRGGAMAIWAMGPIVGPIIGPVAGGFAASTIGWRWIFYIITIVAFVCDVLSFFLLRETYAPRLLAQKTARLQKETENPNLRSRYDTGQPVSFVFKKAIVRPAKMLVKSPIVFLISLYMAICYGYLYLLFTTFTYVFEDVYGFSPSTAGLAYLGLGVGSILGLVFAGIMSDRIVKRMSAKGVMKPEYRLPGMIPAALLLPIGLFWYGWSADKHIHWIMPILGTGIFGIGMLAAFMSTATYLVDAWPLYAASSTAASTVLRSLFGAVLPLAGQSMYNALGLGWGNSLLGFIALALAPVPFVFLKYGEAIRTRFPLDL